MTYRDFISKITFRFIKPETRLPFSDEFYERRMARLNERGRAGIPEYAGMRLEMINTVLPENGRSMKRRLRDVCLVPRMSTLAIATMINRGVSLMPDDRAFVNVGVWHGFTLLAGLAGNASRRCIGVDNFSEFGGPRSMFMRNFERLRSPRHSFYEIDYRDYFTSRHHGTIGFYIYDGGHDYENQLQGLRFAEPFFSDECLVLVDDTNWQAPRQATLDFISQSGYAYEILLDRSTCANCHPTYWNGVMVFQKTGSRQRPREPASR